MGVGGCCNFVKYLLILINFLFMIAGFAAVGLFVWMLVDPSFILSMTQDENHYYYGLAIFAVVSLLMLVVAFLGCSGAFRESKCALVSFFCCLLVVLVAEIVTGAWAYYNKDKLDEMVRATVKYTVHNEYGVIDSKTDGFDSFQKNLECCGANGPNDWATSSFNNNGKGVLSLEVSSSDLKFKVPLSCCNSTVAWDICETYVNELYIGQNLNKYIYSQGCMDKLVSAIHNNISCVLAVIIGIVTIELIGLIFALMLCCAIKNNTQYKS